MSEYREDPEKILQRIQEATRQSEMGKLKVYLGAAPGVGKTYSMLQDALEQRAKGIDVIVGVVETHGRKEIADLQKDFEILPKKQIEYRDKNLLEFDLDAALQRNPDLILIDEMAHTNIPGLRHEKRWQDIKELLDRGINVYTTLNVQHIESLNDKVSELIHVSIKETVPDVMLELATTIELVDIPPDELLERLEKGKVYFRETAEQAKSSFFRKINLIALRELALRVAAEHVAAEVISYKKHEGVKESGIAQDSILVCVSSALESLKLIRVARQLAFRFQVPWMAVYVASPKNELSEKQRKAAVQNLRFAQRLGAKTHVITGINIAQEIVNFARENKIGLILVRKRVQSRFKEFFFKRVADEIVKYSGTINVYVISESLGDQINLKLKEDSLGFKFSEALTKTWRLYFISAGSVLLISLLANAFYSLAWLSLSNILLLYLVGIIAIASFGFIGPAILASVLSIIFYNLLFVDILDKNFNFNLFNIRPEYILTFMIFIMISELISRLVVSIRQQSQAMRFAEHQRVAVYDLNQQLSHLSGTDKILEKALWYLAKVFETENLALVYEDQDLRVRAYTGETPEITEKEKSIAHWVYKLGQMAGLGTNTLPLSDSLYVPLLGTEGAQGVLKIRPPKDTLLTPEQIILLESCAKQIALVLEADNIQEKQREIQLQSEIDRLRSTVLQYLSGDIQAPLKALYYYLEAVDKIHYDLTKEQIKIWTIKMKEQVDELDHLLNALFQMTYVKVGGVYFTG